MPSVFDTLTVSKGRLTGASKVSVDAAGTAAAEVAAHEAAADPHPQYLTQAEGDAAYQPLDTTLSAFAALTIAANSLTIGTGADAFAQTAFAANTFPARGSTGNLVAKTITDFGLSLVDDVDAATARVTLGIVVSFHSLIYNPDFRIAQRGAGPFTNATTPANNDNTYLLDGWRLLSDGNDIVSITKSTAATDGFRGGMCRATVVTANKKFGIFSVLENQDVLPLRNKTVSLSVQVNVGADFNRTKIAILEWTGTADSVSADPISAWEAGGTNPTLIANWAFLNTFSTVSTGVVELTVKNLAVGASANNLAVLIWNDDTATTVGQTFDVGESNLTPTNNTQTYQPRPYEEQLALCQRYFFALGGTTQRLGAGGVVHTTDIAYWSYPLPVTMRTDPSLSLVGAGEFRLNDRAVDAAVSIINNFSSRFVLSANFQQAATTWTLDNPVFGYMSASTRYIYVTAEL